MVDSDAGMDSARVRFNPRMLSVALWSAALLALVIGFADLARGGTMIAPILLVLGYCVLVPIAILK
ncbi:MAG: hypothetical protein H0T48_03715 [Gemmatimonadaceae bacterium]|nr:hypothetical protein [Gemmatimonadaceae bacterium]